ncbi:MAG: methyltransferase domain-containing protein [Streptosporangiaceae bacterium]|nr:methyltransferase domain-containing protein [Streptosporangiaceae bacterium]
MRTPSHWVVTLAAARAARRGDRGAARAAALGAVIPDLPYWLLAASLAVRGRPRGQIRTRLGYDGSELNWPPDLAAHSVLAPAAVAAAAALLRSGRLAALAAGWAGHILCDLPVHHSDARPHGYPLWARRFRSPLSAWERHRHARPVTAAEFMIVAAAIAFLMKVSGHGGDGPASPAGVSRSRPLRERLADAAVFLGAFAAHPAQVGAVLPTSRRTVTNMLNLAGEEFGWRDAKVIVELGAGTGVYTEQILRRAGPRTEVLAFERDPVLARRLTERLQPAHPNLRVIGGDAAQLEDRLDGRLTPLVVSALPWTSMRADVRNRLLTMIGRTLAPGGALLTIQYSTHREREFTRYFGRISHVWSRGNIPPAALYELREPRAAAGDAGVDRG